MSTSFRHLVCLILLVAISSLLWAQDSGAQASTRALLVQRRQRHGNPRHVRAVGLVVQDVEKVIPEAVSQNDKGYLLVNNDPILWTMLNAIKEQQHEIEQLRAQLAKKARRDASLESRLTKLENGPHGHPALSRVAGANKPATPDVGVLIPKFPND